MKTLLTGLLALSTASALASESPNKLPVVNRTQHSVHAVVHGGGTPDPTIAKLHILGGAVLILLGSGVGIKFFPKIKE